MTGDCVYRKFVIEDLDKKNKEEHEDKNAMFALDYVCAKYGLKVRDFRLEDLRNVSSLLNIRFIIHQIVEGNVAKAWCCVPTNN